MSTLVKFDQYKLNTTLYDGYSEHITTGDLGTTTEKWTRGKTLGRGTFGEVWLEEHSNGMLRAVKKMSGKNNIHMGERELLALTTLKAYPQYFVEFLGWFENRDNIYLAMEYVPCGDLASFISEEKITEIDSKAVATQLLEGLNIMHKHKFAHRDLKPQNILIAKWMPLTVKIADFGISKQTGDGTELRTEAGTPTYMAPEVQGYLSLDSSAYTNAVDIWSLGCLIHTMMTKEPPFPMSGTPRLLDYVQARVPFPKAKLTERGASLEAIKFINGLMMPHPDNRPTAEHALKDPWLVFEKGEETIWEKMLGGKTLVAEDPQLGVCTPNEKAASHTETVYYPIETVALETEMTVPSEQGTIKTEITIPSEHGAPGPEIATPSKQAVLKPEINISGEEASDITEVTDDEKAIATEVVEHWSRFTDESRLARISNLQPGNEQDMNPGMRPVSIRRSSTLESAVSPVDSVGGVMHNCDTLYCAVRHQDLIATRMILEAGKENVNTRQRDDSTTLLHMAVKAENEELAKMLMESGADLAAIDSSKNTPLHIAVEKGNENIVKLLLSGGADAFVEGDPNTVTGRSLLHRAARKGYAGVVRILLDKGLVIAKRNDWGSTALYMAACEGHVEVVKMILDDDKHEITRTDNYGDTPLHGAAARGRLEVVKLLVEYGAPIRAKSLSGHTPLSYAVKFNHQDVMKFLSKRLGISTVRARLFRG